MEGYHSSRGKVKIRREGENVLAAPGWETEKKWGSEEEGTIHVMIVHAPGSVHPMPAHRRTMPAAHPGIKEEAHGMMPAAEHAPSAITVPAVAGKRRKNQDDENQRKHGVYLLTVKMLSVRKKTRTEPSVQVLLS